jgi:TolB protein
MKKATLPVLVGLILLISLACGLPSQFHVSATRAAATPQATATLAQEATAATQHGAGQIAFVSWEGGARDGIYIMNADGSKLRQLTDNDTDCKVSLSPDGTRVAFVSSSRDEMYEIYVIHSDGNGLTRLTNNPGGSTTPSWSPDGSQIIYTISYVRGSEPSSESSSCDIYVMNADGSDPHPLTNSCDPSATRPRWSPDGSQILFVAFNNVSSTFNILKIMNADGTNPQVIQTNPALEIDSPRWSPDGTKIAFFNQKTADAPLEIDVINKDGSNQRSLTAGFDVNYYGFSWSPDGQQLIFDMVGDGKSLKSATHLFVVNADGSNMHKLDAPCPSHACFGADWGH